MDGFSLKRYIEFIREPARKRKISIFLICLFCSAIFWLFIRISGESQAEFRQVLQIVDLPADAILIEQSDRSIQYAIQSSGTRLFASIFSSRTDTLKIAATSLSKTMKDGETWHYINSGTLGRLIQQRSGPGLSLLSVRPDTVFVRLARGAEKKVAVRLLSEISYERRFGLYGEISLDPDSVLIKGPDVLIDSITDLGTAFLAFSELNQNVSMKVPIHAPVNGAAIEIIPPEVTLSIPVEEYTESSVDVQLEVQCTDSLFAKQKEGLRLYPNKVSVVFLVALKDYQKIQPGLFSAFVECPGDNLDKKQLQVRIGYLPDFVRMESVRPGAVDYLIMN